jgi:hypothetical protein
MASDGAVQCEHYQSDGKSRRCRDYLDGGGCARPDQFMCVEFLRRNPGRGARVAAKRQSAEPAAAEPVAVRRDASENAQQQSGPPEIGPKHQGGPAFEAMRGVPHDLFGVPVQSQPARPRREMAASTPPSEKRERFLGPVTDEHVAALERRQLEVCVRSEAFQELWLVPAYTGEQRNEMTFRDAATLAALCAAFPQAAVTSFRRVDGGDRND